MRAVFSAAEFFPALESCRREAMQVVETCCLNPSDKITESSFCRHLAILRCLSKNLSVHQGMWSFRCLQTCKAMQFIC
jgi:hypothetical protein